MGVDLIYKHQQKTYDLLERDLEETGKTAYVYPTGAGKTFPALKYIADNPGIKVLYVSPNNGIIEQVKRYISQYILEGKIVNKITFPDFRGITYQKISLVERIAEIEPDLIIFDEIHRMGAEKWEEGIDRLIRDYPNAKVIGMSATPERTDKRNMAYEKFGGIIYEMSMTEALSGEKEGEVVLNGSSYYRVISELREDIERDKEEAEGIEDEEVRKKALKLYSKLDSIVSNAPGLTEVLERAMKKKNGKYIVFCTNREEMFEKMEQASQIFGKVNEKINIEYVISKDGKTGKTKADNERTIRRFENREKGEELNLLFCVDMLNEGRHIEGIDGEIMFRPTESHIIYKQQIGRVLTSDKEAEETIIVDAVNNWLRQIETFEELSTAVKQGSKRQNKGNKSYELFKLTEEELELLDLLKEIREDLRYKTIGTYKEIVEWLEKNNDKMPRGVIVVNNTRLTVAQMTEEQRYEVNLYQRWVMSSPEYKALKACVGIPIDEIPEEYLEYKEAIATLRKHGLGLNKKTICEEIIEWLENHDGEMPKSAFNVNRKKTKMDMLTEEQKYEVKLYHRWTRSPEYKALKACEGIPIDEIPEEYLEYKEAIATLRQHGQGLNKKTIYEEIIEWLEENNGEKPRGKIKINKILLTREQMTEEEKYEVNLYHRWISSLEYKALKACEGIPIDEIPEEYLEYKEAIAILRKHGLGIKKKKTCEEIIEWLEQHNGEMPKGSIKINEIKLTREQMTEEQRYEVNLYARWMISPEYKALKACEGIPIDEIPEEYEGYKRTIETLRQHGQGIKKKTTYEEIIEWLEKNNGEMPRGIFKVNKVQITREQMTEEQKYEVNLYNGWINSSEYKALKACEGIPIDEIPEEYEEYKREIETLRQHGQGIKKKTTCEEIIEWLEQHNGEMPKGSIKINKISLTREQMTEEQRYEVNLYARWITSPEYKALKACEGTPIDEIPEEYREYKEKIAILREYEKERNRNKAINLMKKSVGKHAKDNEKTRKEMSELLLEDEINKD